MKIKLIKFNENLQMPTRGHYNDAGLDCYALEDVELAPNSFSIIKWDDAHKNRITCNAIETIPLGFGLEVPDGYMATIRPRSSMNAKGILTQIGTIDSGYRGEIKCVLINLTKEPYQIKKGDKICQIVIEPVVLADFEENLENTRGSGGFGSTGK